MRYKLNDAFLRAVKPPASGRLEYWDETPGQPPLCFRVQHTGHQSWSTKARTAGGKQTRPMLGVYPMVGLAEARRRAIQALAEIARGGDPVNAKREARVAHAARLAQPTVAARWDEWRAAKAASWSDRYTREVERIGLRDVIPALGKRFLIETPRSDWTDLIAKKARLRPGMGAALYRTCSAFLNHSEASGWVPLPVLPRKGAQVLAPGLAPRQRVLTDEELRAVWEAAGRFQPKSGALVRLLILSAARLDEVAGMRAGEVDREAARWSIPGTRTKNGRGIVLPLGDLAREEIAAVWPEHGAPAGDDWGLLGQIRGSAYSGFSKLKTRIDQASSVTDWRFHDLRRTCRSKLPQLGISRDDAEALLNHISHRSALERTYNTYSFADEIIAASLRWQDYVATLVGENVVRLTRQG